MINADRLAELRVRRGLSQRRLAFHVGVNYQVIRRLEAGGDDGNLTLRHLARLCDALGVPPAELLLDASVPSAPVSHDELSIAQARLFRRIHRGQDVRRSLTAEERELVLPFLVRHSLVVAKRGGPYRLTDTAMEDFEPFNWPYSDREADDPH